MNHTLEAFGLKVDLVGPPWFQNTCTLLTLIFVIWSLFWIRHDARKRGKSPFGALLFALFACYPISLLWWLWLRPPLLPTPNPDPAYDWENSAALRQGRKVE